MKIDDHMERVRAYRAACRMSKRALAEAAGVHFNTLASMDSPSWSPSLDTLRKLESLIPPNFHLSLGDGVPVQRLRPE